MYGKIQASGLTEFILFICTSATWWGANPISLFALFLAFPPLLSSHCGDWQHALDCSFGCPHSLLEALIHFWRPEITDGCDISSSLIWQVRAKSLQSCLTLFDWMDYSAGVQPLQDPGKPEGETVSAIAIDVEGER